MRYFVLAPLALALASILSAAPAEAQATRTWVSAVGDDVNSCSRTAPCKTFAGAISKTAVNGEISCIDPGGFGAVTITKSITIDCLGGFMQVLASGTTGIIINLTMPAAQDPRKVVRLRNLAINGTGSGTRTGINGINILLAAAVFVEDVLITDFTQSGIRDGRAGSGKLFIRNTVLRNNGQSGLVLLPASGFVDAVLDNVNSTFNGFGLAVGTGNKVMVTRSIFSGNVTVGVDVDNGASAMVDGSTISNNPIGIQAGSSALVRLSNSNIAFNAIAIDGPTTSFGNNRLFGNTGVGTALTAAGSDSSDKGQQ